MRRRDKRKRVTRRDATAALAFPKVQGRDHAVEPERFVIRRVRDLVAARDGECRFPIAARWMMPCNYAPTGEPQWAHRRSWRRARTVGQAPAARHSTQGSMLLCPAHHRAYDDGDIFDVATDTECGADKTLRWYTKLGEFLGVS